MSQTSGFAFGLNAIPRGMRLLISQPSLLKWAVIPFIIDLALVIIGIWLGVGFMSSLVGGALAVLGAWAGFLFYPLYIIFFVGYLVLLIYVIFLLATVIAAPFNALLAEETLKHLGAMPEKPFQLGRWVKVSISMLEVSLIKALIFGLLGIVLFIFSFVPVLNIASAYMALTIIAFDGADYSLEAFETSFRQRMWFLKDNIFPLSGMATFLALTLVLPGLTLLLLPANVVGGAMVVADKMTEKK